MGTPFLPLYWIALATVDRIWAACGVCVHRPGRLCWGMREARRADTARSPGTCSIRKVLVVWTREDVQEGKDGRLGGDDSQVLGSSHWDDW